MSNLNYFKVPKSRFMDIVGIFLFLYALTLTLSPVLRSRSWDVDLRWNHWLGYFVWLIGFRIAQARTERFLPQSDPALLPVIALLSGWGLLSIFRLSPIFGLRQTIWLAICILLISIAVRVPSGLKFLREYKYLWLTAGLCLTALTLIFGTNPLGYGPRLWLGCCGIYLQPSEPLKLLLIIYLAAYLADWSGVFASSVESKKDILVNKEFDKNKVGLLLSKRFFGGFYNLQILIPTLVMTGIAILIILVQRDLGTASILIFIYSVMVFLATGWHWVLLASLLTIIGAGSLGYLVFDVIRLRVDAWVNPWQDPSGRSYQIVQSLIAIANGGIFGRGPGLGNPSLVPVAHSDFIFAAIAEEGGFIAIIGLLVSLGLLVFIGLRIALRSADKFHKFLASGITAFIVAQSILIIGGNIRLLPLTGVTLPFISYGGSSLLVSFLAVIMLLHLSVVSKYDIQLGDANGQLSSQNYSFGPLIQLSSFLYISVFMVSVITGWWSIVRDSDLLTRTDNPRLSISDRYVKRGGIYDRNGIPIVETIGISGEYNRYVYYPRLGPVIGYNHPVYGQSGLEASLDPILRGIAGYDPLKIWWHRLIYGQSPPGLDVRLTLDLELQNLGDQLMEGYVGGLVLLNAENGEILLMSSHPFFDPNDLDEEWETLIQDTRSPLLNRVVQGSYTTGDLASSLDLGSIEEEESLGTSLMLPFTSTDFPEESTILEIAILASALSNEGRQPLPSIAQLMRNPDGGWLIISSRGTSVDRFQEAEVEALVQQFSAVGSSTWEITHIPRGENLTWYLGGTTSRWEGLPLVLALVLEDKNVALANKIGQEVLAGAMNP